MMRPSSANAVIEDLQSCIEKETGKRKKYQRTRSSGNFAGMPTRFHVSWNHVFSSFPFKSLAIKYFRYITPSSPISNSKYIVFVVQHGQMDVFLNTFLIGTIRQLLISPIPRDDGILAWNNCKVDNAAVITQHFKGITRFQYPGNIRDFGHIMT